MYVIYKITNNLNGKHYIGKTNLSFWNKGYMGSGKLIKQAVKKNGKKNFTREVLHMVEDEAEAYRLEEELIDYLDDKTYNLTTGGAGVGCGPANPMFGKPAPFKGRTHTEDSKRMISESVSGYEHSDSAKARMSANIKGKKSYWNVYTLKRSYLSPDRPIPSGFIWGRCPDNLLKLRKILHSRPDFQYDSFKLYHQREAERRLAS